MVSTPLKKISQLGRLFQMYGAMKNDPNHQPVLRIVNNSPKLVHRLGEFPQRPHDTRHAHLGLLGLQLFCLLLTLAFLVVSLELRRNATEIYRRLVNFP